ncbi:MAG TPA: hypothetical protein VL382_10095 [Terriglobales bacterium]|nr:hypothetical protein [Terriglobales bacterium]
MTSDERELKSLFQAVREADAQHAPSFARTWNAMPHRDRLGYLRALMVTAAFVLVGILATVNAYRRREIPPQQLVQAPVAPPVAPAPVVAAVPATAPVTRPKAAKVPSSISEWRSPTASLLDVPGDDLLDTVPTIGTSGSSLTE